jgi:hypothetical protein
VGIFGWHENLPKKGGTDDEILDFTAIAVSPRFGVTWWSIRYR